MTAVDSRGIGIAVERRRPAVPALEGNPSQIRGLWAKRLIKLGHKKPQAARLIRISLRQLYRDLDAADGWLREKVAEAC